MPLPRLHLFELEDLAWFPRVLRDLSTDYLRAAEHRFRIHETMAPVLEEALRASGSDEIVDLCSGGAGPLPALVEHFRATRQDVGATLTDLYPNIDAFAEAETVGGIRHETEPIDARDVPARLTGFRTLFNAFHHFRPTDAERILADAVASNAPIGIFEIPDRRVFSIIGFVVSPLFVWGLTPFIRPFTWRRLLWTYILPGVPATCLWDGIVSQWRAYTPDELRAMAAALDAPNWTWRCDRVAVPGIPLRMTYLVGWPPR